MRGASKAINNANDAISLFQTADGTLSEVAQLLQRIRALTVQASSESYTDTERGEITQRSLLNIKCSCLDDRSLRRPPPTCL